MSSQPANSLLQYASLRPLGERQTLLETKHGELFEVDMPPQSLLDYLAQFQDSSLKPDQAQQSAELYHGLLQTGVLSDSENQSKIHPLSHVNSLILCNLTDWQVAPFLPVHVTSVATEPAQIEALLAEHPNALLILLADTLSEALFREIDAICEQHNVSWVSCHIETGKAWLGPLIIPQQTAHYRDLLDRRRCSGNHVEAAQLQPTQQIGNRPRCDLGPTAISWILGLFFSELSRALDSGQSKLYSVEICADPISCQTTSYAFLPMPTRKLEAAFLSSANTPLEQLINPRSGIVLAQHQVEHHPALPQQLITVQSHCCDISQVCDWQNDSFVGGSSLGHYEAAQGASIGEAIERYCGNFIPSLASYKKSYNAWLAAGEHALDPEQMILHSPTMLRQPGCPFVPFTRDLEVLWVKGQSITQQRPAWLPLSLVYANWITPETQHEPVTHHLWTPGMAGGRNLEEALVGGIREVVERDITMAWWLNAHPLPSVVLPPEIESLCQSIDRDNHLSYNLIHLDNPFGIPVFVGVVEDTREQLISIGFGCRPNPTEAAKKALCEAFTLLEGSYDLLKPDSIQRQTSQEWGLLHVPYKPWRADRQYLDDFDADLRDVTDLMVQPQLFLDPRAVAKVKAQLNTPATRHIHELPVLADNRFATYRERVENQGFEIFYADITSPDVALTGMRAVRVIVPGLIPNMPAAFPAVGGERVFQLPVQMGWRETPLDEASLNFFPMPHA